MLGRVQCNPLSKSEKDVFLFIGIFEQIDALSSNISTNMTSRTKEDMRVKGNQSILRHPREGGGLFMY